MGIVLGVAAVAGEDAIAGAAADGIAESAGAAAADSIGAAAADSAGEVAADSAGEVAADSTGEAAADSAGEAAADLVTEEGSELYAETVANDAVEDAVEEVAKKGASAIVQQVAKCTMLAVLFNTIIEKTIEIVEDEKTGQEVKALLKAMKIGVADAKTNLKDWNRKITAAIQAGKLTEIQNTLFGPIQVGNLFSAAINANVNKFLTKLQPGMVKVQVVAKTKPANLKKITAAVKAAQSTYIDYANPFLVTLKTWNRKDNAIKTQAGINFQISQFETNLNAVNNIKL